MPGRKQRREVLVVCLLGLFVYALGLRFDLFEILFQWSDKYEKWNIDELYGLLIVIGLGSGVLGLRQLHLFQREIEERQRIASALEDWQNYSSTLFNNMPTGMVVIDPETHTIIDVNPAAAAMAGAPREKIIGRECHRFICPTERGQCPITNKGLNIDRSERVLLRADGSKLPVLKSVISATIADTSCLIETLTDLSEQKALEKKLEELSVTDELTGIFNRRGFLDMAEKQKQLAERMKKQLFVIFADIDNMKWINDTLGHEVGDAAIHETAQLLCCNLRRADIIGCGRIGGDEFAMLLTSVTRVVGEHPVLGRINESLAKVNSQPGRKYQLRISFGVAALDPENPCTLEELFGEADRRMYECKRSRKEKK